MPGRTVPLTGKNTDYRYRFQGQEEDSEMYGGAVSYKYRVHDPRLGRFLSLDPLAPEYPWNSPYAFSENRVIDARELEGLEAIPSTVELQNIENRARETVENGRMAGLNFAADNLERYLDGAGGKQEVPLLTLRSFLEFRKAEGRVKRYFIEDVMSQKGKFRGLKDGETYTIEEDYWEGTLSPFPLVSPELFYASHKSFVRGTGELTVTKVGDSYEICGTISFIWHDNYDWDPNAGEYYVGGYPGVKVDDLELHQLGRYGKAIPYSLDAKWETDVHGEFRFIPFEEALQNRFEYIQNGRIQSFYGSSLTEGNVQFEDKK